MKNEKGKKKLKSRILSAVLICIGVVLVFVGYWAMQQLLERRQERLLSQSGETKTISDEEKETEEGDEERDKLTEDELEDILIRSEFTGESNPHEPYGRQMTMQEAMETGQAWIESFCAKYGYPNADGTISYEGISAALYTGQLDRELMNSMATDAEATDAQMDANDAGETGSQTDAGESDVTDTGVSNIPTDAEIDVEATDGNSIGESDGRIGDGTETGVTDQTESETGTGETETEESSESLTISETDTELSENAGNELAESMYGYWQLQFSGTDVMITMNINAVTGQVLYVAMESTSYTTSVENLPRASIVEEYFASFGFDETENMAYGVLAEDPDCCYVDYDGKFLFMLETYVYGAAELGYPEDSGYTQSGFRMDVSRR